LHLRDDCPLPPAGLAALVSSSKAKAYQLTADLRLTRRFSADEPGDAVERVRVLLGELRAIK
jgi:hypothetical protein